ncbi:MAG: hypothetical protein LBV17_01140 [Treponema sp.]|nr:hypothetical protein [Treponema sp.]
MKKRFSQDSGKLKLFVLMVCFALIFLGCGEPGIDPGADPKDKPNEKPVPATVTSVVVNPSTATVAKGGTSTFAAAVSGTGNPPQTVTWTIEGGLEGTTIENGILNVAMGETATALTVKATSTFDNTKSGTAEITVQGVATVSSVAVTPSVPEVILGGDSETKQFAVIVTGTNNPAQTVTWEVTGGGTGTSINNRGLLTVAKNEPAATLTVTATSKVDNTKSSSAEVTIRRVFEAEPCSEGIKYIVHLDLISGGTESLQYHDLYFLEQWYVSKDEWEIPTGKFFRRNEVEFIYPFVRPGEPVTFYVDLSSGKTLETTVTPTNGMGKITFADNRTLTYNSGTKTITYNNMPVPVVPSNSKILGTDWEWQFWVGRNWGDSYYAGVIHFAGNTSRKSITFDENTFTNILPSETLYAWDNALSLAGRLSDQTCFVQVSFRINYDGWDYAFGALSVDLPNGAFKFPHFDPVADGFIGIYSAFETNGNIYIWVPFGVYKDDDLCVEINYNYYDGSHEIDYAFYIDGKQEYRGENPRFCFPVNKLGTGKHYGLAVVSIDGAIFSKEFAFKVYE